MSKYKTYKALTGVNRQIRFQGLTPVQFTSISIGGLVFILIILFKQMNAIVTVALIFGIISIVGYVLSKLKKLYENGNPDAVQSYFVKNATPNSIIDDGVFKIIKK